MVLPRYHIRYHIVGYWDPLGAGLGLGPLQTKSSFSRGGPVLDRFCKK